MTSHVGRLYVLACAIVTFFLVWALAAMHPWGAPTTDKRFAALAAREVRRRHEAVLVNRLVARRWKVYRAQLAQRSTQIAAARASSAQAPAVRVRVVNLPPLTPREQDVLILLAEGVDARTIARRLGISVNTCRGYVKSIFLKLDAHSQLEAVAIARKHGLVAVRPAG